MIKHAVLAVALLILMAMGAGLVSYTIVHGAGVSPDAWLYLEAAQQLADDGRYMVTHPDGSLVHLLWLPPGTSALLSLPAMFGVSQWDACQFVLPLLGALGVLAWGAVGASAANSRWGAISAAAIAMTGVLYVSNFGWALSEPVFLPLLGLSIFAFQRLLKSGAWMWVGAFALSCAALCLTRYAGVFLVGSAFALLLMWGSGSFLKRLGQAAVILAVSLLPVALWANSIQSERTRGEGRTIALHLPELSDANVGIREVGGWVTTYFQGYNAEAESIHQPVDPTLTRYAGMLSLLLLPVAGLLLLFIGGRLRELKHGGRELILLPVLATAYMAFVLASRSLFDAGIRFDDRMLAPAWFCLAVFLAAVVHRFVEHARPAWLRVLPALVLTAMCVQQARASWALAEQRHEKGILYAEARWQQSELLERLGRMDPNVTIYTNIVEIPKLHLGRHARPVPRTEVMAKGKENPDYKLNLQEMRNAMQRDGAIIVYFAQNRPRTPELEKLMRRRLEHKTYEGDDGVVVELKGRPSVLPPAKK